MVGAVAGLVGAAVASVLVPAVGATTLTAAGISTGLTFIQSVGAGAISAISSGVAARATNAAVRNSFTDEPKRDVAKEAFNPKAMLFDTAFGAVGGALTYAVTGGLYGTTSIDSRYKGNTAPANPKPTQGEKTSGNKAAENPSDDIVRDSSGEYAGEQYGGAAQGKNAGTTACTEAGQSAGDVATGAGNGGYQAPVGGGGVSNAIIIGDNTITFGHGGRHISGLDVSTVEQTIANSVPRLAPGEFFQGSVNVNGVNIVFRAFGRGEGVINVGTYFIG